MGIEKEREPSIQQISGTDLDKRYEVAKRQCRDSIIVAHGIILPSLTPLGSKEEMETAYELFSEKHRGIIKQVVKIKNKEK